MSHEGMDSYGELWGGGAQLNIPEEEKNGPSEGHMIQNIEALWVLRCPTSKALIGFAMYWLWRFTLKTCSLDSLLYLCGTSGLSDLLCGHRWIYSRTSCGRWREDRWVASRC